jgi:hypothetical protein
MMNEVTHNDIRKLLKIFGVQADEAIMARVARSTGHGSFNLRLTLEELSRPDENPQAEAIHLVVEGSVNY